MLRQLQSSILQEGGQDSEEFGVIPARERVERKERARLKQVKFSQGIPSIIDGKVTTIKKTFSLI